MNYLFSCAVLIITTMYTCTIQQDENGLWSYIMGSRPRSLPPPNPKYFLLHTSHQIFRRMHGALNVDKKDN
jgi:hypothetical protein